MSAPDHDIQGTTVNWVGEEPRLACCMCDNYQQAVNTRAAPRFLLQPMQYSPVCGHSDSQCFDEGDRGNWADRWFHGTRVGHTGPGYPSTRVLTSIIPPSLSLHLKCNLIQLLFHTRDVDAARHCIAACAALQSSNCPLYITLLVKLPMCTSKSPCQ